MANDSKLRFLRDKILEMIADNSPRTRYGGGTCPNEWAADGAEEALEEVFEHIDALLLEKENDE